MTTEIGNGQQVHAQVGALCYRHVPGGGIDLLLVTSRRTRRWIIPKGWPMAGKTAAEAAAQEAWEEAGVSGDLLDRCIGQFTYIKTRAGRKTLACQVDVFPLRVEALATRYPEASERRRAWVAREQAVQLVAEPELAALLNAFAPVAT
ncbi:NUDIX hydrolase [Phaeobacter sp. HF9A]|uniref:NUDIX hydrolase n=1 Tax=Phaeobacter sp. HF9A TaxID=2721561 RepID=UPI0020CA9466|nr:NUDIX hydrolase [Phaeobacter sp. HF9A]